MRTSKIKFHQSTPRTLFKNQARPFETLKSTMSLFSIMLTTVILGVSTDCPNIVLLAVQLNLDFKQKAAFSSLSPDCCTGTGVTCTGGTPRVTGLDWSSMGLNGTINGTLIPSSMAHLSLELNQITGKIPSNLPSSLLDLNIHGNLMTGDVPPLPSGLKDLFLGTSANAGNRFTGSVILNRPVKIYINHNWITDISIADDSSLNNCDVSNNPLLGNQNLTPLNMCTKNNLYSATLLPNTLSFTTTPIKVTLPTTITSSKTFSISTSLIPLTSKSTVLTSTTNANVLPTKFFTTSLIISSSYTRKTTDLPLNAAISKTVSTYEMSLVGIDTESSQMEPSILATHVILSKSSQIRSIETFFTSTQVVFQPTKLAPLFSQYQNTKMIVRLIVNAMILAWVFSKSPFSRELKRTIKGTMKRRNDFFSTNER